MSGLDDEECDDVKDLEMLKEKDIIDEGILSTKLTAKHSVCPNSATSIPLYKPSEDNSI